MPSKRTVRWTQPTTLIHVGTTMFLMMLSFLLISHIQRSSALRKEQTSGGISAALNEEQLTAERQPSMTGR